MLTTDRTRIVSAIVLSLIIHAGIMNLNSGWRQSEKRGVTVPHQVTMTLTARQPKTVESPVKATEENTPVPEEKTPQIEEQKTIQKIEKVIIQEIPRPVAVLQAKKLVFEPESIFKKNVPEPIQETTVTQHLLVPEPVEESMKQKNAAEQVGETLSEKNPVQEEPALLPVTLARPLYKKNPRPGYPSVARRRRYQGTTLLEVLVDSQGRVGKLRVFESCGHQVLDRAALAAVKDWLFEPGRRGDDTVDMWVRVPVRFQLR